MKKLLLLTLLIPLSVNAAELTIDASANMRQVVIIHSDTSSTVIDTDKIVKDQEPKDIRITKNKILIIYQ